MALARVKVKCLARLVLTEAFDEGFESLLSAD
jgi:hypothetical protein